MNTEITFWFSKLIDYKRHLIEQTTNLKEQSALNHSIEAVERALKNIEALKQVITSGREAQKMGIGIGQRLAARIDEILTTGKLKELEDFENSVSDIINELMSVSGIGYEMAKKFYKNGITGIEDLKLKWQAGQIKLTNAVEIGLKYYDYLAERIPRSEMDVIYDWLEQWMKQPWLIAGSYRRGCETMGDIDILISGSVNRLPEIVDIMKRTGFIIAELTPKATKKYMAVARYYIDTAHHLDIRYIEPENWASALLYFTGPKLFNIDLRNRAIDMGYRLSEYGLETKSGHIIPTNSEADIFEALDLEYIPPEKRGCSDT